MDILYARMRLFPVLVTMAAAVVTIAGLTFLRYGTKPAPITAAGWMYPDCRNTSNRT